MLNFKLKLFSQNLFSQKLLLILTISFCFQNQLFAQGGSNYSLFGIGEINRNNGAFYDGMSGTSISVPSEYAINLKNPAMWSYVENTRIQFGYKFNQHLNEDQNQSLYQNNGKINDILTVFSIDTAMGISVSLGLHSLTSVNYYIANNTSVSKDDLSVNGTTFYQGSGGISNVYLGVSARPLDYLAVGASVNGQIGTIKTNTNSIFTNNFSFSSRNAKETSFKGMNAKLGFNLTAIQDLSIGGFVNLGYSIDANNISIYDWYRDRSIPYSDTTTTSKSEIDIPTELGLGVAYKTGKFIIAGDFVTQDFSNLNYNNILNTEYQNSYNMSLGLHRNGNPSRSADYLDRMGYSFGLSYGQMYYKINGQNINELSGSFGVNMPIPGTGMIDAALIVGQKGTTDSGLINEYFGRVVINLSIGDTWFKPIRKYFD